MKTLKPIMGRVADCREKTTIISDSDGGLAIRKP